MRGLVLANMDQIDKALADDNQAARLIPKDAITHNRLAWLLATCPDAKFRNGQQAVAHAKQACELTEWKNASYIGTLAATYAEAGDFTQAVQQQEKAQAMYSPQDKQKWGFLLDLYNSWKPYRQERQQK